MTPFLRYVLLILILAPLACSGGKQAAETAAGDTISSASADSTSAPEADQGHASTELLINGTKWRLDDQMPFDDSIVVDTLDNGLVLYVAHNERPDDRAELRLVVNAGSVLEDDDQRGLAHFVEHMAFNGTEHFEKHEIINYLERHGMRFGADLNAYTSFDETVYMLQVPTDSIDVLNTGFQILRDWASNVSFEHEEIDKERGVVTEEWRLGRGADARMLDEQLPILLDGSRYAERLPIGDPEIIANADYETVKRFYRDWYRPDLMAVVAVGDFDVTLVADYIRSTFSSIEPSDEPRERPEFDVPSHAETLVAPATDPEATYATVGVVYKREKDPVGTLGAYRRSVVEGLYHGIFNNRLGELTQDTDPPFAFAGSGPGSFVRNAEFYNLQALVREGGSQRGLEALLVEAERVRMHGITETELERQKESMLRYYERAYNERDKSESASYAAEYARNFLESESVPGIEFEYRLVEAVLPDVTLDEVNSLTSKFIRDEGRVVVLDAPDSPQYTLPSTEEVMATFAAAAASNPAAYIDRTLEEPLIPVMPIAGSIVEETFLDSLGVTVWQLSNGVRVWLKPTDFKDDQILMSATSRGGTSIYPDSLFVPASTAANLIVQSGIGNFGPIELDKALSGTVASVSPSIGELSEGFGGSASPKDVETMFQLIHLYFTAPRGDETAYESYKVRVKEILASSRLSPERTFADTVTVTMSQGHFRARPFTEEVLEELNLERSLAIFQDRFADAGDFTFYLVGSFDVAEMKSHVEQYLASLPSTGRDETWRDIGLRPPTGVIEKTIVKGIEPKSRVRIAFTGDFDWNRTNRQVLQSLVDVMRLKFREILREDLGGTYGVSISASSSRDPYERYQVGIGWGCDPDRVEELVGQVMLQVDSLQTFGIDESYLAKVREMSRRSHEKSLKENGFWLNSLRFVDQNEQDPMTILAGSAAFMETLDSETIKAAANQYLNMQNYAKFVLLPDPTAAPEAGSDSR